MQGASRVCANACARIVKVLIRSKEIPLQTSSVGVHWVLLLVGACDLLVLKVSVCVCARAREGCKRASARVCMSPCVCSCAPGRKVTPSAPHPLPTHCQGCAAMAAHGQQLPVQISWVSLVDMGCNFTRLECRSATFHSCQKDVWGKYALKAGLIYLPQLAGIGSGAGAVVVLVIECARAQQCPKGAREKGRQQKN